MKSISQPRSSNDSTPDWLRRFAKLVAFSTLFLIFAGAMVTSTGSGLAVPDWPLSYGMVMPPMVGGIFYEHGHRMIAATVGFLTVLQAIWLQLREPKRRVRILGWCSVGAVIAQGLLGGLTVILTLISAPGSKLVSPAAATVTIGDNDVDTLPFVTISSAAHPYAVEGGANGEFLFSRSATSGPLTVSLTISGTAVNGTDYNSLPTTVSFADGQAAVSVPVVAIDDALIEGDG